jgi:hypothetical protein
MVRADTKAIAGTVETEDGEMVETREELEARLTEEFGFEVKVIDFLGRQMPTKRPSREQLAVMARLRGAGRSLDVIPEGDRRNDAVVRTVGSIQQTMASFFASQDDWDDIETALLHQVITYEKLPEVFTLVFDAWNDEATAREDNRDARRKSARRVE